MTVTAILFWACVLLVVYTYVGYGLLLAALVKLREALCPAKRHPVPAETAEATLLIAAWNEQEIVAEVPMSEMSDFSTLLRQITQGRGWFTLNFERYEQLPQMLEAGVIEEAKAIFGDDKE